MPRSTALWKAKKRQVMSDLFASFTRPFPIIILVRHTTCSRQGNPSERRSRIEIDAREVGKARLSSKCSPCRDLSSGSSTWHTRPATLRSALCCSSWARSRRCATCTANVCGRCGPRASTARFPRYLETTIAFRISFVRSFVATYTTETADCGRKEDGKQVYFATNRSYIAMVFRI